MLIRTWAATLRWDWPSNSCVEDLKPFLPHMFLFFNDLSDIFVCIVIFDYMLGRFLLTPGTRWHLPRAGRKYDPPSLVWRKSLKEQWLHKQSIKPLIALLPRQFHPVQTCLVLIWFFFLFSSVYSIFCVSVAGEYLFFCSSVCENELMQSYTYVWQIRRVGWKQQQHLQSPSEIQTPSLLCSHRRGWWPLNVETRRGAADVVASSKKNILAYEGKNDPFQSKKGKKKKKDCLFVVRKCMSSVSPQFNIAVLNFPTLLNWGT